MANIGSLDEFLANVRVRPGMYLSSKSLEQLEAMLHGYSVALQVHAIEEVGRAFNRRFSAFVRTATGWSTSAGWANAIRENLVPEKRGSGVASELDDYAVSWFRAQRLLRAALGVEPRNLRAVRFYLEQGWCDAGEHPRHPEFRLMRKAWGGPPAA